MSDLTDAPAAVQVLDAQRRDDRRRGGSNPANDGRKLRAVPLRAAAQDG